MWALEEGANLGDRLVPLAHRPRRQQRPQAESAMSSWMHLFWALPSGPLR